MGEIHAIDAREGIALRVRLDIGRYMLRVNEWRFIAFIAGTGYNYFHFPRRRFIRIFSKNWSRY